MPSGRLLRLIALLTATLAMTLFPSRASGEPFGAWLMSSFTPTHYIEIPSSAALNPINQITIEA